ncbi:MAG: WD40/YVTN/BNR-like repeat-containing protein, partial [Gemmatimonadota bacterium]
PGAAQSPEADGAAGQPAPDRLDTALLEELEPRFVGPANPSGRVTSLAVPAGDRGATIYAGLASGGLWKTENAGTTWTPVFDDQGSASIGDVAVAPSDEDVVWVGTGERNSLRSNSWGDGVYRSTDGGESWEHAGLEATTQIGRIAVHPDDPQTAWVAALGHLWGPGPDRGVYRTTDAGGSWEQVLSVDDTTGFVDLKIHPDDPDVLFAASWHRLRWGGGHMEGAGAGSGIWRSTDGGDTWTELTAADADRGLPSEKLGRIGLAIHPDRPEVVYAVVQAAHGAKRPDVSPYGGLFRSDDGGDTWTRVNDLSAVPDYFFNEVWPDPQDPDRLWLAAIQLHVSEDGGRTVAPAGVEGGNRVHVDHHAMWVDPGDPGHRILGNDGGVYVTRDDGETWSHQIVPASQFYEVDVDTTKVPYEICGGTQDNGTWCGPSRTREEVGITNSDWYHAFGGDGYHAAVATDSPSIRYHEFQFGNVHRLDVDTWEIDELRPLAEDAGAESGYPFRWDWNTPFEISHHDPTVLYLGGNHLFRLTERGRDWEILGPDMTRGDRRDPEPEVGHTSYRSLHSVAESALDEGVLWTGSNDGLLWASTDRGQTWRNVTSNLPEGGPQPPCWVSEIEPSRFEANTAFVTYDCHRRDDYSPYVYRTDDAGSTWTEITGDLPGGEVTYVVKQSHLHPDVLFTGTHTGVFVTIDGGERWTKMPGLPTVDVRDLDLVPRRDELVVGTFGRSIYLYDVSALGRLDADVAEEDVHLFPVDATRQYRTRDTYGEFGDEFFSAGAVEPHATISYWLGEELEDDPTIEVRRVSDDTTAADDGDGGAVADGDRQDAPDEGGADGVDTEDGAEGNEKPGGDDEGDVIRTLSGDGDRGLHRVTWPLDRDEPRPRELGGPTDPDELRRVRPGTFEVTLEAGDAELTETVVVKGGWVERVPGRVR